MKTREQRRKTWHNLSDEVHNNVKKTSSLERTLAFGKFVLLVLFIVLVPLLLYIFGKDTFFNKEWLTNLPMLLEKYHREAFLILTAMQFVQVVICFLPGEPIQIASSYFYGVGGGYAIAMIGAIAGAAVAFGIAKALGSDAVHLIFGKDKVTYYRKKLNSSRAYMIAFLIYLIPGIPKDLVAYIAGITEMRFLPFLIISTIGRTPGILGSLLIGAFWQAKNYTALVIILLCTCIILYLCYRYRNAIMNIIDRMENHNGKERS